MIKSKTEALSQTIQKFGADLYKQAQAGQPAEPSAEKNRMKVRNRRKGNLKKNKISSIKIKMTNQNLNF